MRPPLATLTRWLGVAAITVALASPTLAQRNVTLRMNSATMPDTVRADADLAGVQVRGCLTGCTANQSALPGGETIAWNSNTTLTPTNEGGDYWSINFQIPDDQALNYKFYIDQSEGQNLPGGWEDGSDHVIPAGTGDVTLDLHYFNKTGGDQAYGWRPFEAEGDSIGVWFRVYMNTENAVTKKYTADDENLVVALRGNFGERNAVGDGGDVIDWGGTEASLSRESTDPARPGFQLFSGLVKFPASEAGNAVNYKFYFNDSDVTGDGGYEDGNDRTFTIPTAGSDTTLHWVYFSNSPPLTGSAVTANVTFQVDVAPLTSIGLFQTSNDAVQVRGGFNGWDCPADNQDDCLLSQDPFASTYSSEIPITSVTGSELLYKFYVDFRDEEGNPAFENALGAAIDVGWEEPLDFGGGNRTFEFSGSAQDLGTQFFNSVRAGNVIPAETSVDVTFQVDMTRAMSFEGTQGRAFDAAKDTVTVQFEDVVWLLTQGYVPGSNELIDTGSGGNLIRGLRLTDPDEDGVYTGTLTVDGPTYNGLAYRYAYGNDTDGIVIEGLGGFDEGRRRYRYITDTSTGAFTLPGDGFRALNEPTPWAVNPTGTFTPDDFSNAIATGAADPFFQATANENGPGQAGALALGAVYPNPTTGVARLAVSAARDEAVTVRVYDVTGRMVVSVLEGALVQSSRTVEINTQALAAGVYVVRAESGRDVATQRLTVVR